jgi:hypothetical protein
MMGADRAIAQAESILSLLHHRGLVDSAHNREDVKAALDALRSVQSEPETDLSYIIEGARIGALEDAAADANALSNDRTKSVFSRICMRVAAKWLHQRVEDARERHDA